jgi:four helix bundle protein
MRPNERDIEERAFVLACAVVRFCDERWKTGGVLPRLLAQLAGAATSVGANLEEASAGQTKPDFITKVAIAHKEARESHYWMRLISACFSQHDRALAPLIAESGEIIAILTAILKNARASPNRGNVRCP